MGLFSVLGGAAAGFLLGGGGKSQKAPPAPDYRELADAQRYAADRQKEAADQAIKEWRNQYDTTRKDFAPWRETGKWAIGELGEGVKQGVFDAEKWHGFTAEDMERDPGYQFRVQEGMKNIQRQGAFAHGVGSGATLKALQRFGQEYAANEFANARNRAMNDMQIRNAIKSNRFGQLATLSGYGQNAVGTGGALGNQQVAGVVQGINQGAAAQGAGMIGAANAGVQGQWAQYNQAMQQNALNQQGFNNLLGVVGLGLGAAGLGSKYGWFGG